LPSHHFYKSERHSSNKTLTFIFVNAKLQIPSVMDAPLNARFPSRISLLTVFAAAMSGCVSMAPDSTAPKIAEGIPAQFEGGSAADETGNDVYRPAEWWKSFNDPVLDGLLEEALAKNLDLAEASARLRAAEAQARVSRSGLFPQVTAGLNSSYSDIPTAGTNFGAIPGAGISRLRNETYSSSLSISYELDIWGKIRNGERAAKADAIAVSADLQSVRLAVLAETITSYFNIVNTRHQIALTAKTVEILADRVEQTESRFGRGLASSFELYQVRQDFRNVQATLPQLESQLTASEGQLSLLVGRYSNTMDELLGERLAPKLIFKPVPTGLPIDLLIRRPDVFAESQRLEAARFNLGAQKATRFPSLSLSAGSGTQAGEGAGVFDILDNWVLNLGAGLTAPLFQGGRIRANIDAADAQYAQQTAVYARTVLNAFIEVGTAIEQYEEERQRYRLIFSQLGEAQATARLQSRRFSNGVGSYVDYLDGLRAQYQVQSALSASARDVALARLGVHRALGGDWAGNERAGSDRADFESEAENLAAVEAVQPTDRQEVTE
jgi:NodT family efflux transporter outer membrane factor (OMF) lipoprotein